MDNFLKLISEGGIPAYLILAMGLAGLALIVERGKTLYFDFSIKTDEFMEQVKAMLYKDQVEEAITYCSANGKAPLAHVMKSILERSDRDDNALHQGLDVALSEVIPQLGRRLGYLSMIANVATLLGLLGTITGLIMAFSAVSFADPSQKQVILAQGISMAMNTTALGLSVAIPIMVAYAFLHSRQNSILEEISEHSSKVIEIITSRHYAPFHKSSVFPKDLALDKMQANSEGLPPADVKVG